MRYRLIVLCWPSVILNLLIELEEVELVELEGGKWYDVAYAVGKWLREHRSYEFETLT